MAKKRRGDTEIQMSLMCGGQDTNCDVPVTMLLRCEIGSQLRKRTGTQVEDATSPSVGLQLEAEMGVTGQAKTQANSQSADWVALVVEDDDDQRDLIGAILEESDVKVISCDTAEAAMQVMEKVGDRAVFVLADVDLAGKMDGVDLACKLG